MTLWRCYSEAFSLNSIRLRMRGITAWARTYHLDLGIALGLFVLAVLIRLPYYLEMPHITDEFREVQIAVEVARGIRYPLFFSSTDYLGVVHSYLLGFFLWLFGTSIQAPRLYMVLMGALAVVLTYWLAREMTPRWPSVIAAGLMLTSPMHVLVASHVAWVNSTTPVFCLLMLIAFYRGAVRERGFSLALSGLMAGLALQTHPTVALLFPGMIVWYVLIQHRKNRSIGHIFRRPALYAAVILFLLAYGNIIWYNAQGRLHVLAAAQRRDAIQHNPLHISVYLTSLRGMLQSLFSSLSGAVPFQFSTIIFGHLGMIFYAVWLLAGLVHVARRNQTLLLFLSLPSLALFPLVNQNWAIPDKSRYLFYLLPLFYLMMASVVVDAACYLGRIRWLGEVRRFPFARLAGVLLCLALIAYPLWPLWDFYQTFQDSEWSNRSLLRAAETLRDYRNQGIPIYVDAEIRKSHLPIVGSNLLKALEYLLFLDGTECEVISFVQHTKPPATFDHEVSYVTTDNITSPSVWVLAGGTKGRFAEQNTVRWAELPDLDWSDGRFGLYELALPAP